MKTESILLANPRARPAVLSVSDFFRQRTSCEADLLCDFARTGLSIKTRLRDNRFASFSTIPAYPHLREEDRRDFYLHYDFHRCRRMPPRIPRNTISLGTVATVPRPGDATTDYLTRVKFDDRTWRTNAVLMQSALLRSVAEQLASSVGVCCLEIIADYVVAVSVFERAHGETTLRDFYIPRHRFSSQLIRKRRLDPVEGSPAKRRAAERPLLSEVYLF